MEGRIEELLGRLVDATERAAIANERIVKLATEERVEDIENVTVIGHPYCPHCQTFDPEGRSEGGMGHMSEFVLVMLCSNCGKPIYGLPQGWLCYKTPEEVKQAMEGRNDT